ncbi:MAG: Rap1a/Tai family immunity protein [Alphaproteobacteria bacterium]|nr:Rap1a/Tai family immunity protein [Alphaproteobacteria bacterium]
MQYYRIWKLKIRNRALFCGALAFLILCFFSQKTQAARLSGEYLFKVCAVDKSGEETIKGGKIACQSYISGMIDYYKFLESMNLQSDMPDNMRFCVPEEASLNEIQIKVLAFFYTYNKLHEKFVAAPAVLMALSAAYPCAKK